MQSGILRRRSSRSLFAFRILQQSASLPDCIGIATDRQLSVGQAKIPVAHRLSAHRRQGLGVSFSFALPERRTLLDEMIG